MKISEGFYYGLLFLILSPWILLSAIFALGGLCIGKKKLKLENTSVENSMTICKVLHLKGLLKKEDYQFETNDVASLYDQDTFKGYLFIMSPVIFVLKYSNWIDNIILTLVNRWINVHKEKLNQTQKNSQIEHILVKISTSIAQNTGGTLRFLKLNEIAQWAFQFLKK